MIGRRYIHKSLGKEKSVAKGKNWPNFVKIKFNIIVVMLNYGLGDRKFNRSDGSSTFLINQILNQTDAVARTLKTDCRNHRNVRRVTIGSHFETVADP